MTTKKNVSATLKPSKKEARKQISQKLENALPELKMALGEKKFLARVKKAAKILGENFALLAAVSEELVVKKAKTSNLAPAKNVKAAKKIKAATQPSGAKENATDIIAEPANEA